MEHLCALRASVSGLVGAQPPAGSARASQQAPAAGHFSSGARWGAPVQRQVELVREQRPQRVCQQLLEVLPILAALLRDDVQVVLGRQLRHIHAGVQLVQQVITACWQGPRVRGACAQASVSRPSREEPRALSSTRTRVCCCELDHCAPCGRKAMHEVAASTSNATKGLSITCGHALTSAPPAGVLLACPGPLQGTS